MSDPVFFRSDKGAKRPLTLLDLLKQLDVYEAKPAAQLSAVKEWLQTNTPNRMLALSLSRHGFPTE